MIELLVVILIVAILAALAAAMFLGAKSGAEDREAMVVVRSARVAMDVHQQSTGRFDATRAELEAIDASLRAAPSLVIDPGLDGYRVTVASRSGVKGGGRFWIERSPSGAITRGCANPGRGGCRATPDDDGNRW